MRKSVAWTLVLAGIVTGACGKAAGISSWTEGLAARYDAREERAKLLARVGDAAMKDAVTMWEEALKGSLASDASRQELFFFLPRYGAIWKKDTYLQAASSERASRAHLLTTEEIDKWKELLSSVHGGAVSRVWTAALLADTEQLFAGQVYQAGASSRLAARLKAVPPASAEALATLLKTAKADAAMTLIDADFLWSGPAFDDDAFDDAMAALRKVLPSGE